jgi:hypothetical protein
VLSALIGNLLMEKPRKKQARMDAATASMKPPDTSNHDGVI